MGGGHLETFTLAAANLLVPTGEKETTAAASTVFSEAEQLRVKQRQRSPRSPTAKLKPPTPAPVTSSPARVLGAEIQPEEEPSQTTAPQYVKGSEEPNREAVSWAVEAKGDEAQESPSFELMVELSPTSSPQVSLQSDDMYVALAEEPSDSGGDDYEDNEASHAQSEVKEEEKADVREGWRGRAGKGKQRRKKGSRRRWPDLEGSHGVRSLAEIYEVTGGELPAFSRKKGRGTWIGPEKSKRECVGLGKSTFSANVGNHGAESSLQGARRAGVREGREGLLDLRASLVNDGLKTLASMMEGEREVVGLTQGGDEEKSLGRDKVVGETGAAEDGKFAEEESDDFLAQTLLDLRGDRDAGFLGAQKASDGPHTIGGSIEPALQQTKRPRSGASRASEDTLGKQSGKGCPGVGTGRDLNVPPQDNGGRSGVKKEKVVSPRGEVSSALPSGIRGHFKEPEPRPRARPISDFLRDIPLNNSTPTRGYTPTPADIGGRSQDLFGASAECIPGGQDPENRIVSMNNGDVMDGDREATVKAKLNAGQSLTADLCTRPSGAYPVTFGPKTAGMERAIVARSLPDKHLSLDHSVGTGNTGVNIYLPVEQLFLEGVNRMQSAGLMVEVSPGRGVSSPLDSSATESDLSAGPTADVGHRIGRDSIVCRTEGELNSSMAGQASLGRSGIVTADANGEVSERGRAPSGVLRHRAIGVAGGQTIVPHTGGTLSEEPQLSSNRPEDIFLARLQSDPRKRAVALLRVLRQGGGLVGWLDLIGLKDHAEYFKKWQITPEMVVGFGREDIKSLGLRVGSRVRLMTAIWDLYQK